MHELNCTRVRLISFVIVLCCAKWYILWERELARLFIDSRDNIACLKGEALP